MKTIGLRLLSALAAAVLTSGAMAAPVISQVGNLLSNGNFEAGSTTPVTSGLGVGANSALTDWTQYSNSSGTTSSWVTSPLVEGLQTAQVAAGGLNDGLYQYQALAGGTYTVSGWVYVLSGTARLGVGWNSGFAASYSALSSSIGQWEYLSHTVSGVSSSTGGALAYGGTNGGNFYLEGMWLNAGATSTSAFAPGTGFNPNAPTGLPAPGTLVLSATGLLLAASRRR